MRKRTFCWRCSWTSATALPRPWMTRTRPAIWCGSSFVSAWQSMAPIMRHRLWKDRSKSIFKLLAYMTASDALVALDELGPALGLDISEEGLRNLAKLLQEGEMTLPKGYTFDVGPPSCASSWVLAKRKKKKVNP